MVNINKYIKALLHPADYQGSHKAHQAGNQYILHVVIYPCPNFDSGLINSPLKLSHGWIITLQYFTYSQQCSIWITLCVTFCVSCDSRCLRQRLNQFYWHIRTYQTLLWLDDLITWLENYPRLLSSVAREPHWKRMKFSPLSEVLTWINFVPSMDK